MVHPNQWLRFGLPLVAGVSLLSAGLADFLFYDQVVGWTLGGFVAWLLLLMLLRNGKAILTGKRWLWGWALPVMTLGLCISMVLEPGTIAAVLAVILLSTLAMFAHGWSAGSLGWGWLWQMVVAWAMALVRPIRDNKLARRWAKRTQGLRSRAMGVAKWVWALAGVVVPLVLSLIFLGLFALANPVVSDWMSTGTEKVGDFLSNLTDYITVGRVFLWYAAAFACWGLLRHRPRRRLKFRKIRSALSAMVPAEEGQYPEADPVQAAPQANRQADGQVEQGEPVGVGVSAVSDTDSPRDDMFVWMAGRYQNLIVRCLVAMNAVFALQLVLDSRYLVLGGALPQGMTYAEYAHRGAYPLLVTAILAAALVLAVFRPGGIAQRSKLAVWLVLFWIVQNIVLVVSAAWRLQGYVEVYTLTRLRVAAGVWMLMVAGCLALLLWWIARSWDNAWLTGWAMGWGIVVLWVCSFVPFDPFIAQYNVNNCKEMGGEAGAIDLAYLEALGPDALPAVVYLIEHLPEEALLAPSGLVPEPSYGRGGSRVKRVEYDEQGRTVELELTGLGQELTQIRDRLYKDLAEQLEGWRGWTVRRAWLEDEAWLMPCQVSP